MSGCKNITDISKQQMLLKYITYLKTSNKSYDKIGRSLFYVDDFIEKSSSFDRRGYKEYIKNNAIEIANNTAKKDAILEFLSINGKGYKRRKIQRTCKPLEKISVVSSKNQEFIKRFLCDLIDNEDYSQHTLRLYADTARQFFEYANVISADNYKRFIATLEERGLSPKTIRLRMTGLEKMAEYAKKPIKLRRPKISKSLDVDNVPTLKEYQKLLDWLREKNNKDHYFFIKILATTGARVSEFLQITWEDVLSGVLIIKGKGNKYRRLFFNKELMDEVRQYVAQTGKSGPVATGRYGTITSRGLSQNMKAWGQKCGIDTKKMHPHAFRHFFAKMFLKNNKDIVQLADLLGHGSIDTTRIYLQKSYDEQKRDFNRNVTW